MSTLGAPRQRFLLVTLGLLLVQVAWLLAIPPFAASDEFDHAYRAAAVARGEWVAPPSDATRGTGAVVHVPPDVVRAAGPECRRLPYTRGSDCTASGDGPLVAVSSGAGRYNPVFYAVVGWAALPFDGVHALYAMRVAGMLLCLALLVAALVAARGSTTWPTAGIALALTPVALFSTTVAAPNGIEMAAAVAFWTALLALAQGSRPPAGPRTSTLLTVATVSGIVLTTVRSLGPLWCVLACGVVLVAGPGPRAALAGVRRRRGAILGVVLVGLATVASVGWTLSQRSLRVSVENVDPESPGYLLALCAKAVVVWTVQSIGAFPTRDVLAPGYVYVCGLALFFGALLLTRRLPLRHRRAVWLTVALSVLIPCVVTYRTYETFGFAWQGRYTLPLVFGFGLVWAFGLRQVDLRLRPAVMVVLSLLYTVMQTGSVVGAVVHERAGSPSATNGDWWLVPVPALGLLAAVGCVLVAAGAFAHLGADPVTAAPRAVEEVDA